MKLHKIIQKRIRGSIGGATIDGDVNAAVAANVGERGAVTKVSSTQNAQAGTEPPREEERSRP